MYHSQPILGYFKRFRTGAAISGDGSLSAVSPPGAVTNFTQSILGGPERGGELVTATHRERVPLGALLGDESSLPSGESKHEKSSLLDSASPRIIGKSLALLRVSPSPSLWSLFRPSKIHSTTVALATVSKTTMVRRVESCILDLNIMALQCCQKVLAINS